MRIAMVYVALVLMICMFIRQGDAFQPPGTGTVTGPYRIAVEFDSGKSSFRSGEPILVSAKIWNASGFPVECPFEQVVHWLFYTLDFVSPLPEGVSAPLRSRLKPVQLRRFGARGDVHGPVPPCLLSAGGFSRVPSFDLADRFKVNAPGQYRIVYSRRLSNPMNSAEWIDVQSPEIFFTVE
jgi:hypothetical protein